MLRDLALVIHGTRAPMLIERCAEFRHITHSSYAPEATACLQQRGADPAQDHLAVAPAFEVARVVGDGAVQVF